ncbi:MAG: hypothetical protein EON93_03400 [Burkholderiales bacterium]|nr:MAG: hypothetical protein EON93_03400 [Burkholderiales bacterium]
MFLERGLTTVATLRPAVAALLFEAVLAALVEAAAFAATRFARKTLALLAARARSGPLALPRFIILIPQSVAAIPSSIAFPTGRAAAISGRAITATSEIA